MRGLKMAELKFEAPLASFEGEEWNEFNDFQTATEEESLNKDSDMKPLTERVDNSVAENFGETVSGSLEDLVNTFDEKITNCFCNFEEKVEKFAPVQIRTQEEIMSDCQMWWTITGNFGNLLPIDWSKAYARQLHTKVLKLGEKREQESPDLDLSDDEELAQAFDMHSLIVSSLQSDQDHILTADEVISEIEYMMQENPECVAEEMECPEDDTYTRIREAVSTLSATTETDMKSMTSAALNELLAQYERTIKELSETLVQELALRDELEFDKELKNQFISLLLTIQKKRRENNLDKKKKKKSYPYNNNNNIQIPQEFGSGMPRQNIPVANNVNARKKIRYLTTVIPYHPQQGVPTSEQLQIYIKILQAINQDSPTVPTLLTDYILKVLCPT